MANRQGDVDWRFVQVPQLEIWLGLEEALRQVSASQFVLVSSLSWGLMTRCCMVLGDIYCNIFMACPTWQEDGTGLCQRPQTLCVCSKYVHFIPAYTHTSTTLRILFQCTAFTLSTIHTYSCHQPRLCMAEHVSTNLGYLMCIIPIVLIQYTTLKLTIRTQHSIIVIQKAAGLSCTQQPSSGCTFQKYIKTGFTFLYFLGMWARIPPRAWTFIFLIILVRVI